MSAAVRASLPPVVQAYVTFRESLIALLRDLVATLRATITKLRGQMAELQARASRNPGNSSRPPRATRPARGRPRSAETAAFRPGS